ncbi:S1 family peptidase [Vibrio nitrifigilis]|uniref:Serine protease n=1 Tax=Vibrio nitrifigilis TaxID=2789781 RepID=A0ABS0GLB3_9VIBR|nr:serine protease [Vibrio nitrifigilis]MBF9003085.1 serine protease [Vibrio nitrifigilis]
MKNITLLLTFLLTSLTASAADVSTYIVNGTKASASAYPAYVTLFYYREYSGGYTYGMYCGGTMIDSTHVLTAAHCITDEDSEPNESYLLYTVVAQVDELSDFPGNATYVQAKSFYYPDDYEYSSTELWPNDIAVITLESSLNVSGVVSLPSQDYNSYRENSDDTFITIGHGKTSSSSSTSNILLQTEMDYVDNATCETDLANINDSQLCFAGTSSGDSTTSLSSGVCSGDSGGPMYDTTDSSATGSGYLQIGVTSFGPSTCGQALGSSGVTGVFTEVSNYVDWINEVVAGSVTAKYTATDAKRASYSGSLDSSSSSDDDSSVSTTSSGGGGSAGVIGLMMLALIGLMRVNRRS